jgi:hypothetical protein
MDANAFFEIVINHPDIFCIRGEASTTEAAEYIAWQKYLGYIECKSHRFDRKGYTNGFGVCDFCGLKKHNVFEATTLCKICSRPSTKNKTIDQYYLCNEHYYNQSIEEYKISFASKPHFHIPNEKEVSSRLLSFEYAKKIYELADGKIGDDLVYFCQKIYIWLEGERDYIDHEFLLDNVPNIVKFAKKNPTFNKENSYTNDELSFIIQHLN